VRLSVVTPQAVVVDEDVGHVRAEDESGSFGILDRHADMLTALAISVLVYRDRSGREHFVAVRGGLLIVTGRSQVDVLTREAIRGDDLRQLESDVLGRFRRAAADEEHARRGAARLEGSLLRRVADYMRDQRRGSVGGLAR
jgi:F-type H+-transporting ATPase subunit epsilon